MIKLNIGCGKKLKEGYINIDLANNWGGKQPDVACDIRKLPFPDDYADEAMAIHVLEHFYLWEVHDILREWVRVLKPDGELQIEVPCLNKVIEFFKFPDAPVNFTMFALYGDPQYRSPEMTHRWCYSKKMLRMFLEDHLENVREEEPLYHFPDRDMRMIGTKPNALR